jgi:hypothetical protein
MILEQEQAQAQKLELELAATQIAETHRLRLCLRQRSQRCYLFSWQAILPETAPGLLLSRRSSSTSWLKCKPS